jgi:uncharacterized protein YecE (DUF72 family)
MKRGGELRVGISGWRYSGWRGKFYPKDLPQRRELEYASRILNSVEINGSFYSLQLPSSYQRWYSETPDDFIFAIKGPRFITHMKRLRDVKVPLANFFASGVLALWKKLGPILWQLPPNLSWNNERLAVSAKTKANSANSQGRYYFDHPCFLQRQSPFVESSVMARQAQAICRMLSGDCPANKLIGAEPMDHCAA